MSLSETDLNESITNQVENKLLVIYSLIDNSLFNSHVLLIDVITDNNVKSLRH